MEKKDYLDLLSAVLIKLFLVVALFCPISTTMAGNKHVPYYQEFLLVNAVIVVFMIFYIINTGQDYRLKSWLHVSVYIISSKLCKKIKKYLIICRTVNLIYHQYDWFIRNIADITQFLEEPLQSEIRSFFSYNCIQMRKNSFKLFRG